MTDEGSIAAPELRGKRSNRILPPLPGPALRPNGRPNFLPPRSCVPCARFLPPPPRRRTDGAFRSTYRTPRRTT